MSHMCIQITDYRYKITDNFTHTLSVMPQSRKVGWISVIINYTVHNRPGEICYTTGSVL